MSGHPWLNFEVLRLAESLPWTSFLAGELWGHMAEAMTMEHIAALSERILFLKGDVTLQASDPVERIQDPLAILEKAMKMEESSIIDYNNFAIECGKGADAKTKQLSSRS
jgi:bacterioferritin (cytochrome b1)